MYFRNGRKDPQIDEGPSAVETVILESGGHKLDSTEAGGPADKKEGE